MNNVMSIKSCPCKIFSFPFPKKKLKKQTSRSTLRIIDATDSFISSPFDKPPSILYSHI